MKTTVSMSAAALGASAWVPLDYVKTRFAVSLAFSLDPASSGTFAVQHTFDNPFTSHQVGITRSGTVATVTDPAHGLNTGDSLRVSGTGDSTNLDTADDVDITVVDANTYTYVVPNAGLTVALPQAMARTLRVFNHAYMVGMTARADGNYDFPCYATRLRCTTAGAGMARLRVMQGYT